MKGILLFILLFITGISAQHKEFFLEEEPILYLNTNQSTLTAQSYTMIGVAGTKSYVSWGDGSTELISWTGSDQTISHTYTVTNSKYIIQFNNPINITKFRYATEQKLYFDLSWFAVCKRLTYLYQDSPVTTSITGVLSSLSNLIYLTYLRFYGANTISGSLSSLSQLTSLVYLQISGSNTVYGDLSSLSKITTLVGVNLSGSNTISDFSGSVTWSNNINYFQLTPTTGGGLDATEIDNLIIYLDTLTWAGASKTLILTGTNAAPTETSLMARTSLITKGVSITTN